MAEYVEREKVCKLIENMADGYKYLEVPTQYVLDKVKSIPAADVRPVVLCRDCGHWNKENQHQSKRSGDSVAMCAWFSRNYGTIETSEGDWCSYGYRREES